MSSPKVWMKNDTLESPLSLHSGSKTIQTYPSLHKTASLHTLQYISGHFYRLSTCMTELGAKCELCSCLFELDSQVGRLTPQYHSVADNRQPEPYYKLQETIIQSDWWHLHSTVASDLTSLLGEKCVWFVKTTDNVCTKVSFTILYNHILPKCTENKLWWNKDYKCKPIANKSTVKTQKPIFSNLLTQDHLFILNFRQSHFNHDMTNIWKPNYSEFRSPLLRNGSFSLQTTKSKILEILMMQCLLYRTSWSS